MSYLKAELSGKNRWHLSKHRTLELKHYCLQYPEWKMEYKKIQIAMDGAASLAQIPVIHEPVDITGELGIRLAEYSLAIERIERIARESDEYLSRYILLAVTEEIMYPKLKAVYDIPCGCDMFYDRYRKFFWLLDKERGI